jgi:hypothetical protein
MLESTISTESLDDFNASMSSRAMAGKLEIEKRTDDLALNYKNILTSLADIKDRIYNSEDARLIDLLETQIESLKGEIQCRDLLIYALNHQLETYELTEPLSKMAEDLNNAVSDTQEKMLAFQADKIDKYKKGPNKKSSDSQQKWALANEYFKAEIPVHRTLKAARLAAAKKAGIVAEERRLTKMLPDPR